MKNVPNDMAECVAPPRDPVRREGRGLVPDPERPLPFCAAGDAVVKVERMDRRSSIPWRMTMPLDSDGAETWALTVAGDCDAQRSRLHPGHIPMPLDEFPSVTGLTGACVRLNAPTLALSGRRAGRDNLPAALAAGLLIILWAVQAQSDPTDLTRPIVDGLISLEWDVSARNAASTSGAARVGETLTMHIPEFADTHGLRHATFTCGGPRLSNLNEKIPTTAAQRPRPNFSRTKGVQTCPRPTRGPAYS